MTAGAHRHFAAVRVYSEGRKWHLNYERLLVAVQLLENDALGRISDGLREAFPELTPGEIHDYFCAAQVCINGGVALKNLPD
ncbi:hypothetical protein [Actinoplanes sp. NPDC051494]|uniref:hypothetical protein n=1 Tax=Actinoplanes sp. NPDC051494 TaxID=3363907 RepID=UPI00378E1C7B